MLLHFQFAFEMRGTCDTHIYVVMVGVVGVGVLVDVHVGDLMAGVRPQRPVARLAGDGAGAEAGGVVTVVTVLLLRRPGQGGAARPARHQPRPVVTGRAQT